MDLDDVNGNVSHGVHVAAMAGTWVSLVSGFGGLRDDDGRLSFAPRLPTAWTRLAFRLRVGDALLAGDDDPPRDDLCRSRPAGRSSCATSGGP